MDDFMKDRDIRETSYQLSNKRETYKQIKYALSKQGDYINEQLFHGFEMNIYNRTLKFRPKNIFTKGILYLSHYASNYGQSMVRPIIFLFLLNGPLFLLLVYLLYFPNVYIVSPENSSWNGFGNALAAFIKFNNPLRKNEDDLKSWALIIDYMMRIIASYTIYNIIRASRRFIK